MLIVAQFGNFVLPAIVMSPIPLTLIGIIPGHMIMGASFTATSMIGFIALAGIIVRNSILLVDFSREAVLVHKMSVVDAVIHSCEARTRPIVITGFALIGGSLAILTDPIFQGMAVSLIFGGFISTVLTLLVVPLGCISAGKSLCAELVDANGNITTSCADPADCDMPTEPAKKTTAVSSSNANNDETFIEKVHEVLSTIFGVAITIMGLVFAGIKGLVVLVFNLVQNKVGDKPLEPIDLDAPVVKKTEAKTDSTASKSTEASSKPVSWQEPWIKKDEDNTGNNADADEKVASKDKVESEKEGDSISKTKVEVAKNTVKEEKSTASKAKTKIKPKTAANKKAESKEKIEAENAEDETKKEEESEENMPKPKEKSKPKAKSKEAKKNKPKPRRGIQLKDDI
jgi:hypothetical protein